MADDGKHHEIVIIRRGGHGDHDEHHGGVWKIAFADFMTAMMAFFLVMWLISANDKTRASVARYFNPVRLVDATTQPRGLHDTKKDESGITASPDTKKPENDKAEQNKDETGGEGVAKDKAKAAKAAPKSGSAKGEPEAVGAAETTAQKDKRLDAALRDNPMVALAEIASTKGPGDRASQPSHPAPPVIGRRGGDAFRDPFAPPPAGAGSSEEDLFAGDPDPNDTPPRPPTKPDKPAAVVRTAPGRNGSDAKARGEAEAKAVAEALKPMLADGKGPKVEVRHTDEGLLLSLTDTADFAMFSNGSAVPAKRVVLMMEGVAKLIRTKPGVVIVRGYTDNKPYRSARYDNWHLSLDRAQVAHYMLVRGGLDDNRIGHVEGYADRDPRRGLDPSNPLNRRIEILVKEPS